jgi:TatD DNase family protein
MIDSHAHLHLADFADDREAVMARLRAAGVRKVLEVGIDREGGEQALALAAAYPELRVAVGCHPHEAAAWSEDFAQALRGWAAHPRVLALGELGLDHYRDYAPRPVQELAFRAQLRLGRELDLPIVFHVRAAEADFLRVLADEGAPRRAVLHAFSHEAAFAAACLERGFWLGIGGILTYPRSSLREILRTVPVTRILLETDCPWLPPVPHRGRRNEPAHLVHVLEALAALYALTPAALEAQLDANFADFSGES